MNSASWERMIEGFKVIALTFGGLALMGYLGTAVWGVLETILGGRRKHG